MYKCKNCGAYLDPGEICDCEKSRKERAMLKEAMCVCLKYIDMLFHDDSALNDKAFRIVMTEIAEKYGADPEELMKKSIDSIEEFVKGE